jgi:hypothetical protein
VDSVLSSSRSPQGLRKSYNGNWEIEETVYINETTLVHMQITYLDKVVSENGVIQTTLKWRRYRFVTGFFPPPGGAIAARN